MGKFTAYKLSLKSMAVGEIQTHEYKLDNEFFANIDGPEVQRGKVNVKLDVKRTTALYELNFHLTGVIYIPCDRCLDDMEHEVNTDEELFVKMGTEYSEESDNLLIIPETEGELNVAWFLYEYIALTIPLKHVHPYGKCNKEMSIRLHKMSARRNDEEEPEEEIPLFVDDETANISADEQETDPRWDALKKLKRE